RPPHRKAAVLLWAPTPSFSMWRLALAVRHSAWSPAGSGSVWRSLSARCSRSALPRSRCASSLWTVWIGESHASRHRKTLARQIGEAKSQTRRGNHEGCDDRPKLRGGIDLSRHGGDRTERLDGQGL